MGPSGPGHRDAHLCRVLPARSSTPPSCTCDNNGRAATIGQYDGFIIVTPEYNHSTSGVLKNAIDYLYAEWNNKAVAVVSYGAVGGVRAAEHLRLIAGELQMADVRTKVALSMFTDFVDFTDLAPGDHQQPALETLIDQVIAWSAALAPLRAVPQLVS